MDHNSGSAVRISLNFAQLKGTIRNERNNNGLYQKKFVSDKWAIFGPKMAGPKISQLITLDRL